MAMSDSDWKLLSESKFLSFVRTVYEHDIDDAMFPDVDLEGFVREMFTRLHLFDPNAINLCLKTLGFLIQEREGIEALKEPLILGSLQKLSGLECDKIDANPTDIRNVIEAEKCMSNLIYISPVVQKFYSISGVADAITQRIKETTETKLNDDIRFYDMRLLFLLTTFNPEIRQRVREKFHGLSYLFEIINQIMLSKTELIASADIGITLSNSDINYLIEILKTLYNLTVDLPTLTYSYGIQEEEEGHLMRLVSILRELLLCYGPTDDKQMELGNHIINLLTNMPMICYEELLSPVVSDDDNGEHDGKNIDAIQIILHFLDYRMTKMEGNKNIKEGLLSVLQLLIFMCQANRTIRKFCRRFILPVMGDEVFDLANEEQTLRYKLTCLMINSNSELKTLSAKLLFVLCKENVNRLIKYTGIGHASGLLYDLGLLELHDSSNNDQYSSDSDEFEIENDRTIASQYGYDRTNIEPPGDSTMTHFTGQQEYKMKSLVIDPNDNSLPVETILKLRETNLNAIEHHSNLLPAVESSNNEDQIKLQQYK